MDLSGGKREFVTIHLENINKYFFIPVATGILPALFLNMLRSLSIIFFVLFVSNVQAQSTLNGRIYEKASDSVVAGINVWNNTTKASVRSDKEGRYSITANEGDIIIFSGAGFANDTLMVSYDKLLTQQDITMEIQFISLRGIKVNNSYYKDSLARRNEYSNVYNQKGVTGGNRPTDGVGVSVSALSFFSYKAKKQRELKRKLEKDEEESYIDYSFPVEMVKNFTKLEGDSLRLFMYRYRPSYEFCRKTDRANMLVYVSDKLKDFRKPEN